MYNGDMGMAWCRDPGVSVNSRKGLCSGWLPLGGLDGGIGSDPSCDRVSGAGNWKWCDAHSSGEDFCVSTEWRDGGRDRVMRLGTVMVAEGYLRRGSL